MEIKSLTCWTDPLHFQLPPTKNLRASTEEVELKARLATLVAEEAALVAVLVNMINYILI